jgi:hypothetical protein
MTPEQRRQLLGDDVIDRIHTEVDQAVRNFGIPLDALADLRMVFGPVLTRMQTASQPHRRAA